MAHYVGQAPAGPGRVVVPRVLRRHVRDRAGTSVQHGPGRQPVGDRGHRPVGARGTVVRDRRVGESVEFEDRDAGRVGGAAGGAGVDVVVVEGAAGYAEGGEDASG